MSDLLQFAASTELRRIPAEDDTAPPSVSRVLTLFREGLSKGLAFTGGLLVRVAETALEYGDTESCYLALGEYLGSSPPRDQHWVRGMLVHGRLRSREAQAYNGTRRQALVREGLAFVLQGLMVAEGGGEGGGDPASYAFLVYNASCVHWESTG